MENSRRHALWSALFVALGILTVATFQPWLGGHVTADIRSKSVPCRDLPFSDDQKRACAQRVRKECAQKYPEGGTAYGQCTFDGITGTNVTPPPLNVPTLPLPQAAANWDGTYTVQGTLACTTNTGKKASWDMGETWAVGGNTVTDINGGRTPIDSSGNVSFVVQSSGLTFTYRLHFARSGNALSVSGSATGGGDVTNADGTVTHLQCTVPLSGGGIPSSDSSHSAASVNPRTARNVPCQGSLRDTQGCIQRARMYCGSLYPAKTGPDYNQCIYDQMSAGGADNPGAGDVNSSGTSSPPQFSSSSSTARPLSSPSRNCGAEPLYDCTRCNGLPSYPTFQYEDCLTACQNDFHEAQVRYNQCMGW